MIFKWNSELLEASTLKSSKETGWSQINILSLTAVDFFDLDRLFVKGEIPECSPTLTLTLNTLWLVLTLSPFSPIYYWRNIKICCDSLYKNQELLCNISKNQFEKLLRAALSNNYFLFDGSIYQQIDGVAMGSPLGPSLANAFLAHYEQIWLNDCPDEFKPVYYKRYVDDIFVLFQSPHHLEKFNEYLNTKHANIKFTSEKEVNGSLPFLDVLISRNKKGLLQEFIISLHLGGFNIV